MKRKNKKIFNAIFIFLIIIGVTLYKEGINFSSAFSDNKNIVNESDLEIYYIDVGQADSILIRNSGKNTLIDAGNNEDGEKLVEYFKTLGIKTFDYVIGTHAHEDHIGGLDDIIKNFEIKTFYMPDVITTTKTFEEVLDALDEKNYFFETPKINSTFSMEDCLFNVLHIGNENDELNNTSIVLMMYHGNNKYLFTGDAEHKVEKGILHKDIKANVLKVGHHGSDSSTSDEFLKKVNPNYAIIEVGDSNKYNHPSTNVLNKFINKNIKVYRTDLDGTIRLISDGNTINFETLRTDTNG